MRPKRVTRGALRTPSDLTEAIFAVSTRLCFWHRWGMLAIFIVMSDVTRILSQIEQGDQQATEKLLPLVYDELRKLASVRLAQEKPGQTLQATALVHEAYLRLVGADERAQSWDNRGHFFAAAAEAMRRILVEAARRKGREKHGGLLDRQELVIGTIALPVPSEELLAI